MGQHPFAQHLDGAYASKLEHWKVFDKRKLCLGLANYGFYYKGLKPGQKADGPLRDYGSYITYKEFLPRLANGWTEEYDPAARCPTISRRTERSS